MVYVLPQLLTQSAAKFGSKTAVQFESQSLSFEELDALTNQVARALQENGVRRGDRVGIFVNKSMASVIAVFGIMKTGAAYVPLDPNAPAERLAFIANDCNVQVLLSVPAKLEKSGELLQLESSIQTVLLLEEGGLDNAVPQNLVRREDIDLLPADKLEVPGFNESDLAYILYTSGSTGQPKGVMITHRTILTFVNWSGNEVGLSSDDVTTSHAPLHFDLSTFDIYASIQAGARLVLIPEGYSIFPVRLADLLAKEKVTVSYLVPSILVLLLTRGNLSKVDLSSMRTVIFAGEVFPIKFLKQLAQTVPQADLFNWFGPTETNVCTSYKVQAKDLADEQQEPLSIGRGCKNTDCFVVDTDGKIVDELGVRGELLVRGPCVASGYWNNPEATSKGFVENPFQSAFSETIFRTGDIVELNEEGDYIYHGRRDHMVKTRGYRVELGEVETRLASHDGVSLAIVVPVPDDLLGNILVAYVEPHEGAQLEQDMLQKHCLATLPRYMVPERCVVMDALPVTSSGKTDRVKLMADAASAKT